VSPLSWSPDGQWIAFVRGDSEKLIYYGVQRLAIVPSGGGEVRILAADLDRNVSLPRWSPDAKSILCLVEDDRTQYLARVSVADGHLEPAVGGRRVISDFTSAPASDRWAVISATAREPDEVYALQGSELRRLSHQNDSLLAAIQLGGIEEISFPSKDGTVINGFLITPPDYIPGRRYPTLLRLHGGPTLQAENALDANGYLGLYLHILAARGYAVLSVNPRGSSGRGEKFASAIFADWGNQDAQDVLAAVDYAVARGVADPSRLGIGGWSYGAILTNYVITQDHRFRAATSGAGMSNMLAGYGTDQYVREWELELGTPWTRTATYLRLSAPFLHADRITTPTLFLGGEKDFNVPLPNGEQMYQALRSLGRPTALIIYPGEFHGIRRPSFVKDRMERYLAWYDRFLRKGGIDSSAIQPGIAR
jgi:dipeptidyl aminopeptidase/acylaminoacyl peptidase